MASGFVRFVIRQHDPDSGRRQGLFQALAELDRTQRLRAAERGRYLDLKDWFNQHLSKPRRLARSRRPRAKEVAISWFKDTAVEHIAKMRSLAGIVEAHGILVDMLHTRKPGYVVYEDEFQVAAEPFSDTGA